MSENFNTFLIFSIFSNFQIFKNFQNILTHILIHAHTHTHLNIYIFNLVYVCAFIFIFFNNFYFLVTSALRNRVEHWNFVHKIFVHNRIEWYYKIGETMVSCPSKAKDMNCDMVIGSALRNRVERWN
jgi:hypothetical protein